MYDAGIDNDWAVSLKWSVAKPCAFLARRSSQPLGADRHRIPCSAGKARAVRGQLQSCLCAVVMDAPATSRYAGPATFFSGAADWSARRAITCASSMIEQGGKLDGKRILKAGTVQAHDEQPASQTAFPIYFAPEKRLGTGFGTGFSVHTGSPVRISRTPRRIRLGRRGVHALLGQPRTSSS